MSIHPTYDTLTDETKIFSIFWIKEILLLQVWVSTSNKLKLYYDKIDQTANM